MKKPGQLLAGTVLSLSLMASVSHAGAAGAYVGGGAGMFLPIESHVSVEPAGTGAKLSYNPGFRLAAVGGYQFGSGLRGEGELNFRRVTTDKFHTSGAPVQVDSNIWSCGFMANAYYDFVTRTAVTPFIGAGLGCAVVNFGRGTSNGRTLWNSGQELSVAYQGIAGFALALGRQTSLDFVYHHYATPPLHFDTLDSQYKGLNLSTGIRHRF
ncbi:MAG TPA: outer membrane beta-barrel protein [Geomonas sp.]